MMQASRREAADVHVQGAFHQWLRGDVVASRILPRIWAYRCRVSFVGRQSAGCLGERHRPVTTNAMLSR